MRVLLIDIPVGFVQTTDVAEYYNSSLSMYREKKISTALNHFNVRIPTGATYTLGLLSIASVLRASGHEILYRLLSATSSYTNISNECNSSEVVLFSAKTNTYPIALNLARQIKAGSPDISIIFGGPHPTALPEEVISNDCIDIVCVGEGEETILELIEAIAAKQKLHEIKSIFFREAGKTIKTNRRSLISNLDTLLMPAYDLLPNGVGKYHNYIETGRGCNNNCSFCANGTMWKCRIRKYSPRKCYDNLLKLSKSLPEKSLVHIVDPSFGEHELDLELCKMLISNPLNLNFSCDMCADKVDPEIISLLVKAGIVMFCLGIESADNDVLKKNDKRSTFDIAKQACATIRSINSNVLIKTYWIVGLPGETEATAKKSRDWIINLLDENLIDICCEHIFVPYPGCNVFSQPEKYDYAIHHNKWDLYDARSFPLPGESKSFSMGKAYIAYLDLLRAQYDYYNLENPQDRLRTIDFIQQKRRMI
jgi:radical SAM superfamily enzyme YgiQ (UPF0313 family)